MHAIWRLRSVPRLQFSGCLLLALSGHRNRGEQCLLSGVKRTSHISPVMSAYEPKQTLGAAQRLALVLVDAHSIIMPQAAKRCYQPEGLINALQNKSQWRRARGGCRWRHPLAVGLTRCARHDGHEVRLRQGLMRGLHCASEWNAIALLRHAGRKCGRIRRNDDRGDWRDATRSEPSEGMARSRGGPMRLLSVGANHVRGCVTRRQFPA